MKTTKQLARELGLLRERKLSKASGEKNKEKPCQNFSYLVVIDFESTCWERDKTRTQEIIEFPAVLLNTQTGQIESEFQYYVQPQEHPTLSAFCHQLTGISQEQVENGIPLSLCLRKFSQWLHSLSQEKNIRLAGDRGADSGDQTTKLAAIVTWSDWDLGVCLHYELKRKQITKAPCFNKWIDLRATYTKFYGRKPKGLNGALQDVGIEFEGREHSGLHDSRNTAMLAWRMIRDGCVLSITKSLVPAPTNVGGGPHPHLQQAKAVCRSGKGGTKGQGNATASTSHDKAGFGTETKPGLVLPSKTTVGLRMRNPNLPHSPPSKNRHDGGFETTQKRPAMFTPLKSPTTTKCPRLSTPKKIVVPSSTACVKNRSTKEKAVDGNKVTMNSRLQSSRSCASMSALPPSLPQLDSVSDKVVAVTGGSLRTPGSVVEVHAADQHNRQPSACSSRSSSLRTLSTSSRAAPTFRSPVSTVFPSTRTESFRTPQNGITPSTFPESFRMPQNSATKLTSGGSSKTPQNSVTPLTSGGSFKTLQNSVTSLTCGSSKTPQNSIPKLISGGSSKTPQNSVTPLTSGGSSKTPQNSVTPLTSGGSSKTPQNSVTPLTSGGSFKTPHNGVTLFTSGGSSKTPQNGVTPLTSGGSFKTPLNGMTQFTSGGSSKTPHNGVTPLTSGGSSKTPHNGVTPLTSGGSSKTPHNGVTPLTSGGSSKTPQIGVTLFTSDGSSKTPHNGVTPLTSGGSSKTPHNGVTPLTSGGSSKTPHNGVTPLTSGGSSKTPQIGVTLFTSDGSSKTPHNGVTPLTSGGSSKTPHNGVTPLTSGGSSKTPHNGVTPLTSGGSSKTPQIGVTLFTSGGSFKTPHNGVTTSGGLSKTFHNGVTSLRTPQNPPVTSFSTMKATPPLCKCGRRAKRRLVQNPGPNMGRWFFSCVRGMANWANTKSPGCGFFQWERAITMLSARAVTPVGKQTHVSRTTSMGATRPFMPVLQAPVTTSKGQRRLLGVSSVPASTFR